MFYLFLFLFLGCSYLYYRFQSVSDKTLFLKSSFFISVSTSFGILLAAIIAVNSLSPTPLITTLPKKTNVTDTIKIDTVYNSLMRRGPGFHYYQSVELADKYIHFNTLLKVLHHYESFSHSNNPAVASIGQFGLGVLALRTKKYKEAEEHFDLVPDQNLPWLHFCKGEAYRHDKNLGLAEEEYKHEITISHGNGVQAMSYLIKIYKENNNFKGPERIDGLSTTRRIISRLS